MRKFLFQSFCFLLLHSQAQYSGKLGYAYSPRHFPDNSTGTDVANFYNDVVSSLPCGSIVMWNGLWYDNVQTIGQVPVAAVVNSNATPTPYPYEEINTFTFFHFPSLVWLNTISQNSPNNFTNQTVRDSFLYMLKTHAIQHQPANVFIGNEINFYLSMDSTDYSNFKSFYNMAYDTVKFYSPGTQVGTIFNYEHLAGKGSLTGWNTPHWNALTDLDTSKMDMIGITLYPFFNYQYAHLIPGNYLDPLIAKTGNKKIRITETGWPADSTFSSAPWACSASEQVSYSHYLFDSIVPGKNISSINWLFLNYLMSSANDGYKIFRSVSMRDSLDNDRPVKPYWESSCVTTNVLNKKSGDDFNFYPNPTNDILNLNLPSSHQQHQIRLYSITGNLIQEISISNKNSTSINLKLLNPGIYFIQYQNSSILITKKIIIQ